MAFVKGRLATTGRASEREFRSPPLTELTLAVMAGLGGRSGIVERARKPAPVVLLVEQHRHRFRVTGRQQLGANSGLRSVVRKPNAAPPPSIGRHTPAKLTIGRLGTSNQNSGRLPAEPGPHSLKLVNGTRRRRSAFARADFQNGEV